MRFTNLFDRKRLGFILNLKPNGKNMIETWSVIKEVAIEEALDWDAIVSTRNSTWVPAPNEKLPCD